MEINFMTEAAEDAATQLVLTRDRGIVPEPDLVRSVRARFLLGLREKLQKDDEVRAVVTAAVPATDAFEFVESRSHDLMREGTEDIFRDAIMFLLVELDELRKAGDQAYVVDTSTGEIIAPINDQTITRPSPWEDENGIVHLPGPALNPEIARDLIVKSAEMNRNTEIQRKAADPRTGFAYKHLTEPERILDIASDALEKAGARRVQDEAEMDGGNVYEVVFGEESVEADTQSTNPLHHRLWSYSAILAKRIRTVCQLEPGGSFWIGRLRNEKDEEKRWHAVHVRVSPPAC